MLPHRSDTSQGHLHPPLALVLHCLSLFFLLSLSLLKLRLDLTIAPPGWFLPCGRLCRHFPGGACASPLLPPSRHYPVFATTRTPRNPPSSQRNARRCNGHCLRVKSFHPQAERHSTRSRREAVVYTIFGTSDRAIESFYDDGVLEKNVVSSYRTRESDDRGRFPRLRFKTPFRSVRVYSNVGFLRCFISRYPGDIGKPLVYFIIVIMSNLKCVIAIFNYDKMFSLVYSFNN